MNSTTLSDYEKEILDNIEVIIWVMAGIAICVALSFMRKVLDNIIALVKCIYYVVTCDCCHSNTGYVRQRDCSEFSTI